MSDVLRLPFDEPEAVDSRPSAVLLVDNQPATVLVDAPSRAAAVDPLRNIVLEASAGTGKTRVLVERYVNLLRAGVEPDHILAITFTRKAAAEMRQRIIDRMKEASRLSEFDAGRWRELKERFGDIAISTIDAFCLSLLREFPLEADVDPGFELADDTQVPRLVTESLDAAFRICRGLAKDDEDVALLFAQLGERRLRNGIGALLDRRLVAPHALRKFLARGPRDLTAAAACAHAASRLRDIFSSVRDGLDVFLDDGPVCHPQFQMLAADIRSMVGAGEFTPASFRNFIDRLRAYFLKQDGDPRGRNFTGTGFNAADCRTDDAWKRHRQTAADIAPLVADAIRGFRRDLNVIMSRGVWRIFAIALQQYERTLDAHALMDFSGVLDRAVKLLKTLDEFAESRLRLEARHRHVLVDEFQDTSRAQWELVLQLIRSWGEGFGAAADAIAPSIFVVGDRKQSIYGFRDADVSVVDDAAEFIEGLRPEGNPRQAITVSFRSDPAILAFVNDVFAKIAGAVPTQRRDGFRYDERDRFPETDAPAGSAVTFIAGETVHAAAEKVGDEIVKLLGSHGSHAALKGCTTDDVAQGFSPAKADVAQGFSPAATVRDRSSGLHRDAKPADIAILFRSRDSHRDFESALERRGVSTYVYKGLGFFDADEVQDAVALLRYLADPLSDLRASALLRSRIVRISDTAVAALGPRLAQAIVGAEPPSNAASLDDEDARVFTLLRASVPDWLARVDRETPSDLLDAILRETAYPFELHGPRERQARENLKKLRAMIRRVQNRGYATLARIADHLDQLAVGDESNAAVDAIDAVSLMTVHAAKGLEFPIVFVVNMGRGTGGVRPAIRVVPGTVPGTDPGTGPGTDPGTGPGTVPGTGPGTDLGTVPGTEPSVAIADYQSEADEDASAREKEESKRLLYVALTRARDRLYLSGTVQDGKFRTGRGSLAEVLPDEVKNRFVEAIIAE